MKAHESYAEKIIDDLLDIDPENDYPYPITTRLAIYTLEREIESVNNYSADTNTVLSDMAEYYILFRKRAIGYLKQK